MDQIRKAVPDISISSDIITGFPYESEEEHAETMQNLEKIGFSFLHVFPYSRRKGTAADSMGGFVDSRIVKKRVDDLLELSGKLRTRDMERFDQGDVLIEREDARHPGWYKGYTAQYHPAKIKSPVPLKGRVHVQDLKVQGGEYKAVVSKEAVPGEKSNEIV